MPFVYEADVGDNFAPYVTYQENFGFVPNLLRAQSRLPRLAAAHVGLEIATLVREGALSRIFKEELLLVLVAGLGDSYTAIMRSMVLRSLGVSEARTAQLCSDFRQAPFSPPELELIDFCLKLSQFAPWVCTEDIAHLRERGYDDDAILEASLIASLSQFLCALSRGLQPKPDGELARLPSAKVGPSEAALRRVSARTTRRSGETQAYVRTVYRSPETFRPYLLLKDSHGFIPNFFKAQAAWPDVAEAQAEAVVKILGPQDFLTRVEKECILLAVSAANLSSYCVAAHCNLLRGMGLTPEEGDQVAIDHHEANISDADKALVDFALKITKRPDEVSVADLDRLRGAGFSDEQILESVSVTALNNFANTHHMGLGIIPDFEPPLVFEQKKAHLFEAEPRHIDLASEVQAVGVHTEDPDGQIVADVQAGRLEAFEELARRHTQRIYRTLMAILGDTEEAKDALQDTLLSAFKHIGGFKGRSKFSTWIVSIARNTAFQRLRGRKNVESLDEDASDRNEDFRPRQVRAWQDDPEQLHSKEEIRQIVERGIMGLPANYRVVVMLRDIEQLSTDEVAEQLGLSVPALKARLFRGRLMLREALSRHFTAGAENAGA